MRWTHIYLSMFSLATLLFFSVTGITLNHPDWFFGDAERTVPSKGNVALDWLHLKASTSTPTSDETEPDASHAVAKLEIVEHFRKTHGVRGALSEFRADDRECLVAFKGPGYAADAVIDRESGTYKLNQTYHGFLAVINDLHKGRDTGPGWSVLIDVSAVLMTLISLTGLVLLFYLKLRRIPGLIVTAVGLIVVVAVYWFFVP